MDVSTKDTFRDVVEGGDFLILDTETTGLKRPAEIIEIAIMHSSGYVMLDMRLKPYGNLPPFITDLTGITAADLEQCTAWRDVHDRVATVLAGQQVITYNAKFDRHMLHCTDEMAGLPTRAWRRDDEQPGGLCWWHCAMEAYAEYNGEWDEYHGNFRWKKLVEAAQMEGLPVAAAHSALGDCKMTLGIIRSMQAHWHK